MCNRCRKRLTLELLEYLNGDRFLEVGFGSGDVMIALAQKGLRGTGVDLSERAVQACDQRIRAAGLSERLEVRRADLLTLSDENEYDLAIAFEVLEHMEDDLGALTTLRQLLRPGGHLLISVPAHRSKWGATDVWAGHLRRYDRDDLQKTLQASGLVVCRFLSTGFPLLSLAHPIRNVIYRRALRSDDSRRHRTLRSGTSSPAPVRRLRWLIPAVSWLIYESQKPFLYSDRGEEYFLVAQRAD